MKIELKKPTMEDKDSIKAVCNAVDRTYLSERMPDPYTDESAEWWINMIAENDGKTGLWRLIMADGKHVGNISVELGQDVYRKDGEIGYLLLTEYWSKGIMTDAARQMVKLAFEKLDIIRITGLYYEPNLASGRVLEKIGFQNEGKKINGVVKGGKVYNLCITGLLKENFIGK
ncbi:Protein N-acetyltransferase, RimJ/RimL family [Lachnospiraceae bacterium]|nr:Protein N-acetyltransferase, RimJ/RimL family [Lachnospiraceae bacterium]